jgi:hypothetical protein
MGMMMMMMHRSPVVHLHADAGFQGCTISYHMSMSHACIAAMVTDCCQPPVSAALTLQHPVALVAQALLATASI